MQPFARRLKEARQERGLSQTDLGGERYSGSYISHLEKGRRAPTPEVVDYLASRLGVAPTTLVGRQDGATASGSGTPDLAIAALDARLAWESRDHFNAIGLADVARKAAVKEARPEAWWAATHLKAQALLALEAYDDCVRTAEELLQHHFGRQVAALEAEALVLASRASRASGRLEDALAYAERAVRTLEDDGDAHRATPQRVQALIAHLSALAELGRLEETTPTAQALAALRDDVPGEHLRGLIAWALGNVAIMRGEVEDGIAEHDRAAQLLNPASDLRAWGRFCKASAAMRLSAEALDGVGRLLELATNALSLVGNDGDRMELALVCAEHELKQGRPSGALDAVAALTARDREDDSDLPPQTRAELYWLRHRCHVALGDIAGAAHEAGQAAELFESAGALPRAIEAWRVHASLLQERNGHAGSPS